jgi:hypothetical protein
MLRWAMPVVFAMATTAAFAADNIVTPHVRHSARSQLPAGLPRAHYNNRTTVTYGAPPPPREVYVERDPDVLFTPSIPYVPVVPLVIERPLLPGSSTLPGYYGSSHSYAYQGPYYGGPGIVPYWDRLPYACGVYGYC